MRAVFVFLVASAIVVGCSNSSDPSPRYSDLSKRMDAVMQKTKGDPSKLSSDDLRVVADAKAMGMTTPPGY